MNVDCIGKVMGTHYPVNGGNVAVEVDMPANVALDCAGKSASVSDRE